MRLASLQTPPPVQYPVGRTRLLGAALLALAAAGAVVLALWAAQGAGTSPWRLAMAGALCLACNGCAWHFWRRLPQGALHWDGERWCFENRSEGRRIGARSGAAPTEGVPEILLDLQDHLALRWRSVQGHHQWLWLTRASDAARWADLRRAIYARVPHAAAASAGVAENASPDAARFP